MASSMYYLWYCLSTSWTRLSACILNKRPCLLHVDTTCHTFACAHESVQTVQVSWETLKVNCLNNGMPLYATSLSIEFHVVMYPLWSKTSLEPAQDWHALSLQPKKLSSLSVRIASIITVRNVTDVTMKKEKCT